MRRPFLFVLVLAVSLLAVMWGYGAFVAPYSPGGWWGPNMMTGPGMWGGIWPRHDVGGMARACQIGMGRGPERA